MDKKNSRKGTFRLGGFPAESVGGETMSKNKTTPKKPDRCRKALEWLAQEGNTAIAVASYWLGTVSARGAHADVFTSSERATIRECARALRGKTPPTVRQALERLQVRIALYVHSQLTALLEPPAPLP